MRVEEKSAWHTTTLEKQIILEIQHYVLTTPVLRTGLVGMKMVI